MTINGESSFHRKSRSMNVTRRAHAMMAKGRSPSLSDFLPDIRQQAIIETAWSERKSPLSRVSNSMIFLRKNGTR